MLLSAGTIYRRLSFALFVGRQFVLYYQHACFASEFISCYEDWHNFGHCISMTNFHENASVIYTNSDGKKIDTFVIFDTDTLTGLTQINHENLRVSSECLVLHSKTACQYHMPLKDAFSFELLHKLKDKYKSIDEQRKTVQMVPDEVDKISTSLAIAS